MIKFTNVKSFLGILALLALLTPPWTPTVAAGSQISVAVDGQTVPLDQPAVMSGGRVMVPLRGVFERLGASVSFNSIQQSVTASRGTTLIELFMNSTRTIVNGAEGSLDAPPLMMGSRILVPLRFVSEALGADVQWQAYNNSVNILSRTGGADLPYLPSQPRYHERTQQPYHTYNTYNNNTYNNSADYNQNNGPFQLALSGPAPASSLPQYFDIAGTTQPYATVRINVTSDMPRHGFLGMSGPTSVNVLNTTSGADSQGNFLFHVDASNLASGAHIVVTLNASNTSGGSSNEMRIEYARQ